MKGRLANALQTLYSRGVECTIITRKSSFRDDDFTKAGIKVLVQGDQNIRAAVIDRTVLWFGSIELAGSRHREDDNVMRINAPVIASEMIGYILDNV